MALTPYRTLAAAGLLAWAAIAGANGSTGGATGGTAMPGGSGADIAAGTATGSGSAGTAGSGGGAAATSAATGGGTAAKPGSPGAAASQGKELFTSGTAPSCAVCHVLRDANATGNIGPNLDELRPDAARVAHAVKNGFENMPAFGNALSDADIQALSRYVEQATAGK
jgi:cytochrome c6